ncbi:hypothetical protein B0A48_13643 [Cryoendolithus antarcticus]|uniref:Uncharacterized protein n=1 Tax=Cryoendolithus antarcticus TaxID=1507870 RepID=A0A1V8SPH8_9PEZI|nr:hypothetical protein B0A48_13643 [Cryoendolithus antarcticus]
MPKASMKLVKRARNEVLVRPRREPGDSVELNEARFAELMDARQATCAGALFKALADGTLPPNRFPFGQANCLAGMHLVFYGWNYPTLYNDQLVGLMNHYGGDLEPHASKETSWVILETTSEAGFFELIRRLPGTGPSTFTPETAKKMGASAARKAANSRKAALLAQANGSGSVATATPRNHPFCAVFASACEHFVSRTYDLVS